MSSSSTLFRKSIGASAKPATIRSAGTRHSAAASRRRVACLIALQYDLADIGIVTTPYHPDKVPFHNLPYATPLVTSDIGLAARTMSELVEKYPVLAEQWKKHKTRFSDHRRLDRHVPGVHQL